MSLPGRPIATVKPAAYLRRVLFARIIRFLTILALALSPLATVGGAPALAMTRQAAMTAEASQMIGHQVAGHEMAESAQMAAMPDCKDRDGKSMDQPCDSGDCVTACAAVPAIPAVGGNLEPHALAHGPRQLPALASVPHGLVPEAATPPPRGFLKI